MEDKTSKCIGDCDKCPFIRWTTPRYFYEEPKPICTLEKELK